MKIECIPCGGLACVVVAFLSVAAGDSTGVSTDMAAPRRAAASSQLEGGACSFSTSIDSVVAIVRHILMILLSSTSICACYYVKNNGQGINNLEYSTDLRKRWFEIERLNE